MIYRRKQKLRQGGMALLMVLGLVLVPAQVLGVDQWIKLPLRDDARAKPAAANKTRVTITTRGNAKGSARTNASVSVDDAPPDPAACSACCRADEVCACGSCISASAPRPRRCPASKLGAAATSCCGDPDSECTQCNDDCCLGDDVCSCKGTCVKPGDPLPECKPSDFFKDGSPKRTCCRGRKAEARCNGKRPEEPVECERDCCPVGMFCSGCGQCFPDGAMPPLCGFPPGVQVSCCDDDGNPCTRCNDDCCLGTDQCSCKGTCVAEGEPMPECGPDDYNDINGLPKVNCCDGKAGADRCAVLPPKPPAPTCQGDCCPEGSSCIGCGRCIRDGDPVPMCDFVPGLSLSCCKEDTFDTDDERCTVCNEDCCLGSDKCSCKGKCVAEGDPMPECGPDDYHEETGFPKKNCCGDQVGLERCADIPRPVTCKKDCCPEGMKCNGCGECVLESDDNLCVGYFPGAQVSCCDDVGNPCTRCNDKCCLGTDQCSCKGTCVAKGDPMPECGPDDYNDINGLPMVHCCQGEAGPARCAVV